LALSGLLWIIAAAASLGWAFDVPELAHIHRGWPTMQLLPALGFAGLGAVVSLRTVFASRGRRWTQGLAAAIASYGLLSLLVSYVIDGDRGGVGLVGGTQHVGGETALGFALLGVAALVPPRVHPRWPQALTMLALGLGGLEAVAFVYHVTDGAVPPKAIQEAVGLIAASTAVLTLRPDAPILVLLRAPGAAGVLVRRLLPLAIASPLISGWLLLISPWNSRDDVAMLAPFNSALFALLVFWAARVMVRNDMQRLADERRFRQVFDNNIAGMLIVNSGGYIVSANHAASRIFGYSIGELTRLSVEDLVPAELRERHRAHRATAGTPSALRMASTREFSALHRDGRWIPTTIELSPIETQEGPMVIVNVADLTARHLAEQERAEHQERFRMLTRATGDTVWDWDPRTDQVWWSENLRRVFGWEVESAPASWARDKIHPDDLPQVMKQVEAAVAEMAESMRCEYRFRCADGSYRTVLHQALILWHPDGTCQRRLGTIFDISERIAAERVLQERTRELERSNAELERFAQIASHDLQEPLRTVSSFVQLIDKKYGDRLDETGHRYMNYAVDGANRMRALIDALLTYSRLERKEAPVDAVVHLARIAERVNADLRVAILECGARVTCDALPAVLGNKTQLAQIFQNLIGNALKYRRDEAPRVHIGVRAAGELWQISVADNGIGIEPRYFDRIFVVFQRLHTREAYDGTGIGLAICKRIVERHGGTIWVESTPGEGSTFHFTLKRAIKGEPVEHVA
jgi:PAS domain S-box-containing protein